jgi:hypothetical protein
MNRTILTVLAIASICCIGVAVAGPEGIGLGLMAGNPSGLSLKVWTGPHVALDAGLGYSYWWNGGSAVQVHGDVLWHSNSLTQSADGYLPLYIGLGARVKLADVPHDYPDTRIGIRIPFGLEYVFSAVPIGLFLELVPTLDLAGVPADAARFEPNSSIGFRYYFSGSSDY